MKLLGIGAGNSSYEVGFFRETYKIPFPLIPDENYTILDQLGTVRTPFFVGINIKDNKTNEIFHTKLGGFEDAGKFLELILKESGLK